MPSPSEEKRICAMVDSYIKKISKHYARNLDRAEENWNKHYSDEPVDYILELLGREDDYPSDSFVLYADGHACAVESEILYKELLSLLEKQQSVLLLGFWCELTDTEIAEKMGKFTRLWMKIRRSCCNTTL